MGVFTTSVDDRKHPDARSSEKGATAVEYALMVGLLAIGIIGSVTFLKGKVGSTFNRAGTEIAQSWTFCAMEYDTCTITGSKSIRYGLDGKYVYFTQSASFVCNNAIAGDPYFTAFKKCWVAD